MAALCVRSLSFPAHGQRLVAVVGALAADLAASAGRERSGARGRLEAMLWNSEFFRSQRHRRIRQGRRACGTAPAFACSNLALPFIFTKKMMSSMSDHMDSLAAFSMHPVNVKPRPRLLASDYECSSDEIA